MLGSDNSTLATLKYKGELPERGKLSGATGIAEQGVFWFEVMNPVFKPNTT